MRIVLEILKLINSYTVKSKIKINSYKEQTRKIIPLVDKNKLLCKDHRKIDAH